jgi:hypothetical protein
VPLCVYFNLGLRGIAIEVGDEAIEGNLPPKFRAMKT